MFNQHKVQNIVDGCHFSRNKKDKILHKFVEITFCLPTYRTVGKLGFLETNDQNKRLYHKGCYAMSNASIHVNLSRMPHLQMPIYSPSINCGKDFHSNILMIRVISVSFISSMMFTTMLFHSITATFKTMCLVAISLVTMYYCCKLSLKQ